MAPQSLKYKSAKYITENFASPRVRTGHHTRPLGSTPVCTQRAMPWAEETHTAQWCVVATCSDFKLSIFTHLSSQVPTRQDHVTPGVQMEGATDLEEFVPPAQCPA
jgi:hypothetical protein